MAPDGKGGQQVSEGCHAAYGDEPPRQKAGVADRPQRETDADFGQGQQQPPHKGPGPPLDGRRHGIVEHVVDGGLDCSAKGIAHELPGDGRAQHRPGGQGGIAQEPPGGIDHVGLAHAQPGHQPRDQEHLDGESDNAGGHLQDAVKDDQLLVGGIGLLKDGTGLKVDEGQHGGHGKGAHGQQL